MFSRLRLQPGNGKLHDPFPGNQTQEKKRPFIKQLAPAGAVKVYAEARMAVFEFIEGWYNPRRRHSAIGYLSPVNYERSQLPPAHPNP